VEIGKSSVPHLILLPNTCETDGVSRLLTTRARLVSTTLYAMPRKLKICFHYQERDQSNTINGKEAHERGIRDNKGCLGFNEPSAG
jgi:hypothetical protein